MSEATTINIGAVLRRLRIERKLTLTELSESIDEKISTSTLNRMELKNLTLTIENLKILADFFGSTVANIIAEAESNDPGTIDANGKRLIPLIHWRDLKHWKNSAGRDEIVSDSLKIPAPLAVSGAAFALVVQGNSMQSAAGESYPEGFIIIIEPNIKPNSGDAVIVQPREGVGMFRKLVEEGGDKYLRPINPDYKTGTLDDDGDMIGPVICTIKAKILQTAAY